MEGWMEGRKEGRKEGRRETERKDWRGNIKDWRGNIKDWASDRHHEKEWSERKEGFKKKGAKDII